MKSAVAVPAAAPVVGRRGARSRRVPAAPQRRTLAKAVKLFRRLDQPGFMRYGRPDDYGELREAE